VGSIYNGTTQAVLGIVDGLKAIRPKWDVALLGNPQGASFHDLARAYPGWPVHTALPERPFTVALRPSQPWHIREMVDLHRVSLFNAYLLLDTIAWDIGYAAPPQLEGTWQFLADHADAFLFDSEFTRRRFIERFPSAGSVPGRVTHLSFDPDEYARSGVASRGDGPEFILVIGNNLDHKDVRHTVDALASAFPYRHIRVLGPADVASPFVRAHESGTVSDADIHGLYASAQLVVFPSFYEGFGFPIVTALAYGKTVLARRSALVEEVAAQCVRRGRLVTFTGRRSWWSCSAGSYIARRCPSIRSALGLGTTAGRSRGPMWRAMRWTFANRSCASRAGAAGSRASTWCGNCSPIAPDTAAARRLEPSVWRSPERLALHRFGNRSTSHNCPVHCRKGCFRGAPAPITPGAAFQSEFH
jgi:hypothetical protein